MKFILLSLIACVLICHPVDAAPQSYNLEVQRLAIAKIRVLRGQSGVGTGAAIYVGNDQQSGYFVTAYHTIDPNKGRIKSVDLQFFNSPEFVQAEIVDKFDPALDVGIIKTNLSNIPSQIKHLFVKQPNPTTVIRIIGHPPGGDWSIWSGHVENENGKNGDSRHFIINRDNSLTDGYSGGGVFDVEGNLLGMHLAQAFTYGKVLKTGEILNLLAAFRVPTNNFGQNSSENLENPPPSNSVENKEIKASSVATAIDRDFDGTFDDLFTDRYHKLHIRKTATNHLGAPGPGEFRAALSFDLRVLPKNVDIRSVTLSVSPSEITGGENINIEVYGFVDYLTLGLRTEAFNGGVRVAGPIRFLGTRAFAERMHSVDVSSFIKQAISDGHRMIGFSLRQSGDFTKGPSLGTGFSIESGEAPTSRNSIEDTPHLNIEYQESPTVDRVDYNLTQLECDPINKGKGPQSSETARLNYRIDSIRNILNQNGKPVSEVDATGLTKLVSKRLIVVHGSSQNLRVTRDRFAHLLIMRDGTVNQLAPFDYAVNHVGEYNWKDLSPVKDHSIGIELENAGWVRYKNDGWYNWLEQKVPDNEVVRLTGDNQWNGWHRFTDEQIHTFFAVVCALRSAYPTITDMVGHSEIDNRVGDPGLIFPMEELRRKLFPQQLKDR